MTGERTHTPSEEDIASKAPVVPKAVKGGMKFDEPYGTVRSKEDSRRRYYQDGKFFDSEGKPLK